MQMEASSEDKQTPVTLQNLLNHGESYVRELLIRNSNGKFLKSGLKAKRKRSISFSKLVKQPSIIVGQTKPYQLEGLTWLVNLYDSGLNGILADEMGLGKTFQTISLIAFLKESRNNEGPHLILAPKSTIGNWMNELNRFCPSLRALKFVGDKKERADIIATELDPKKYNIFVTSYEICCKAKGPLSRIDWSYVIIDEAHRIKNELSKLSLVVRTLNTEYRLLITGTPLQNNLKELWALLNFLFPEIFSSSEEFQDVFNFSATEGMTAEEKEKHNLEIINRLHSILRPFMLRRSKKDVLKDMPSKNEMLLLIPLRGIQKRLYQDLLRKNALDVSRENLNEEINLNQQNSTSNVQLLNLAMQLRKACNHPYLFEGYEDRDLDPFGEHLVEAAGKLKVLDKLLSRLYAEGSRALIFSQMTRMLDILEDYCRMRDYSYFRIDGNTETESRDYQIAEYNKENSKVFLFLLSTRAGGLGINLASANVVVLYDSDWNPQVDLQAVDRVHRIGQTKPVSVYRLVHEHTIEEKIIEKATLKLQLDSVVIQQGRLSHSKQSKAGRMGASELLAMVQFGADHVFKAETDEITDKDLDAILSRGAEHAEKLNSKLHTHVKKALLDFNFTTHRSLYEFEGVNYSKDKEVWNNIVQESKAAQESQQSAGRIREARRLRQRLKFFDEDWGDDEPEDLSDNTGTYLPPKYSLPHSFLKLPQMQDWQFFDRDKITKLHNLEVEHVNVTGSTEGMEKEKREKQSLISQGFGSWARRDFLNFIRGNEQYGRDDIEGIASAVEGKPLEEVKAYNTVFWERYAEIADWQKFIKRIEAGEQIVAKKRAIHQSAIEKIKPGHLNGIISLSGKAKSHFTDDEDRWILNVLTIIDYGRWNTFSELAKNDPRWTFNWFMKTRPHNEFYKRAEYLAKLLKKN